jgi:uncharacterized protein YkwD
VRCAQNPLHSYENTPNVRNAALVRILIISLLLISGCSTLQRGEPTPPTHQHPIDTGGELQPELLEVFQLVNEVRAKGATCGTTSYAPTSPLTLNSKLTRSAQKHSEDMAAAGVMSHTTPEGAIHYTPGWNVGQRIGAEDYQWQRWAENIAWGYRSASSVMQAWLNSPGHCRNIMNPAVTELGLGLSQNYWTQVFASPR